MVWGQLLGEETCGEDGRKDSGECLMAKVLHGFCGVGVDGLVRE